MERKRVLIIAVLSATLLVMSIEASSDDANSPCVAIQAYELRMAGKLDEAQELLNENSKDAKAYFELSRVHFIRIYVEMSDDTREVKECHQAMKQHMANAEAAIEQAIKIDSQNPRYHYFNGVIAMYEGVSDMHSVWTMAGGTVKIADMLKHYEKALEIRPDYHQARLMVLGLYDRLPWYRGGDKQKAKQYAEQLKAMDDVYGAYAECELRCNDKKDKVAIWREVVSKQPDSAAAHKGLGMELLDDGQLGQAVDEIEKTLKLDNSRSILLLHLARAYKKSGKLNEAEEYIQRYLDYDPKPAGIYRAHALRRLAKIKKQQGQNDSAESLFKQADEITKADIDLRGLETIDLDKVP